MEEKKYQVVSLSGGKDSTAMLLMMLEKGEHIDEIVTCDTGMEFPEMYEHLDRLEVYVGIEFTRLKAKDSFEHMMFERTLTKGKRKGEKGYGWARPYARWCTSKLKTDVISRHFKELRKTHEVVQCVGIALDEPKRVRDERYPLVEYGITEAEALEYCYDHGFDWGGLYEKFKRVSCWCCPLQPLDELRTLRKDFPELWKKLLEMDERSFNTFRIDYSAIELEEKFKNEESQQKMF